ncbi:MAG: site-specific integrase [Butyricicoccus pullicaecorum]|nr:site-specific integrase [Butyricicoccus pullicaecorum]
MRDARLAELNRENNRSIEFENKLFLEEMKKWLDTIMVHEVKKPTLDQYQYAFSGRIAKFAPFKKLKMKDLTSALLKEFVTYENQLGLDPDTVRKDFSNISKFLEYLWRLELIHENLAKRGTKPRKKRKQQDVYTLDELNKLLELFKDDPIYLYVMLAANYGMRRSEICGLKWDAVDLKNGYLDVRATGVVDCGKVIYSDSTKSKSSRRRLPLSKSVSDALKMERFKQQQNKAKFGSEYKDNGFVCCWTDGSPLRPDYISNHYKKVILKKGFRFVRLKNLRNTAATVLHNQGFDVKNIQGLLGHADVQTTANIYVCFDEQNMHGMVDTLSDALRPKV